LTVTQVKKVIEGRPNIVDLIKDGGVQLIMNTPVGKGPRSDDFQIRRAAVQYRVPTITTLSGCEAAANAIEAMKKREMQVCPLQDHHAKSKSV
jgi:carbamoyl-phosphate synthase large subunit